MTRRGHTRRSVLKMIAGSAGMLALPSLTAWSDVLDTASFSPQQSDLIRRENQRQGTRDWMLTNTRIDPATKYRCPWIEGYCSHTSLRAGEELTIHVSTNLDTHADAAGLLRARGFLSVGHDEYYSIEMFRNLQQAIAAGLNVAFFSGNTCCGQIEFQPDFGGRPRTYERVDFYGPPDEKPIRGMETLPHKAPSSGDLVGARNLSPFVGGSDWTCRLPDHWIFAGTRMKQGESIPGLVGWEWHGDPAKIDGLQVVASGPTQSAPGKPNGGTFTATVYPGPKGNFVFNASTCWWADGLSEPPGYVRPSVYTTPQGPDRRVQQITTNILRRMLDA